MKTLDETRIDREEINNAVSRLKQRQAGMTEQYNQALSHLANCMDLWARGNMTEDDLNSAYLQTNLLKLKSDPELFNLAHAALEAKMKYNLKINAALIATKQKHAMETEYKKLFNCAVANGKTLSEGEKIKLRENVTNDYRRDLDNLFMALNDYTFKYNRSTSNTTFQEYSKIDFYPVPDTTGNTTQLETV